MQEVLSAFGIPEVRPKGRHAAVGGQETRDESAAISFAKPLLAVPPIDCITNGAGHRADPQRRAKQEELDKTAEVDLLTAKSHCRGADMHLVPASAAASHSAAADTRSICPPSTMSTRSRHVTRMYVTSMACDKYDA